MRRVGLQHDVARRAGSSSRPSASSTWPRNGAGVRVVRSEDRGEHRRGRSASRAAIQSVQRPESEFLALVRETAASRSRTAGGRGSFSVAASTAASRSTAHRPAGHALDAASDEASRHRSPYLVGSGDLAGLNFFASDLRGTRRVTSPVQPLGVEQHAEQSGRSAPASACCAPGGARSRAASAPQARCDFSRSVFLHECRRTRRRGPPAAGAGSARRYAE